ncbi:hypothetical protein PV11_03493 [Exophiala sideris]|uniref:Uncharacterized protein n=1 Tax=Exophiala sideris TaxID=1016849 RepID=A0A0D1Z323_9EURO|nr:hypothetical protein PV11_03493 [Exophiala sideris]
MPRRKKSTVVNLRSGESYSGRTASNVCPRDLLEQKYDEALSETRPTTLYAENTIYHVERIQRLFKEKTYTFNLDDNPIFCVITHIVSLAFDDATFRPPDLNSPNVLFRLRARRDKEYQPIPWRKDIMDVPIFRRAIATREGVKTSTDKVLTYNVYQA